MGLHSKASLGARHPIHNWEYANAAARTGASGFVSDDLGKIAKQLDDNTLWQLTATTPTWKQVDGGGAGATDHGALTGLGDDDHTQYILASGTRPFAGNQSMGNNKLTGMKTGTFTGLDKGSVGASNTINWGDAQKQKVTLTANTVFTFTAPNGGQWANLVLIIVQDGTGNRDPVWPGNVLWPNGSAPNLSNPAGSVDIVYFTFDGTNYYGEGGSQSFQ